TKCTLSSFFFFSSRRRHTRFSRDWSSDVCSSDLSAALVTDLKQRGLLDETLVIWGGEFGRTPMVETNPALGRSLGRDHHPQAFKIGRASCRERAEDAAAGGSSRQEQASEPGREQY